MNVRFEQWLIRHFSGVSPTGGSGTGHPIGTHPGEASTASIDRTGIADAIALLSITTSVETQLAWHLVIATFVDDKDMIEFPHASLSIVVHVTRKDMPIFSEKSPIAWFPSAWYAFFS
ncbi:MAG: hypothetical protein GYA24_16585 [Candidatus Lokiarchaeota archaeon]|nr:hypothetical protein [Candidatus Lokiarchaeota archaeon]